jgi:predicted transcriptional regulator of viral defense system
VGEWTFLTNHAHVLVCIARDPDIRVSDVARLVGITPRAALRIVGELVEAGYLDRVREGRRTHYTLRADLPLRHPVEQPHRVGDILHSLGITAPTHDP